MPADRESLADGVRDIVPDRPVDPGPTPVHPRSDASPAEPAMGDEPVPQALPEPVDEPEPVPHPTPAIPPVVEVADLDWAAIREAVLAGIARDAMRETVERMEGFLDRARGPGLLFDADRAHADDRAIRVRALPADTMLWFIGDLHGDLLALEAALALIRREAAAAGIAPCIVFLGDIIDDGGYGLALLLRLYALLLEAPDTTCLVLGNHDEALQYTGARFTATVRPSDFADLLNEQLAHEWITRAGKLAVRLFDAAPRALFFPDGLLVTHGGFPLVDLHPMLRETGDWNDERCLSDFTWTRAHTRARRKMPNRTSRGSQFGHEDFGDFCLVSAELGRPVTHMVRGHDHVDERYEIPAAYAAHPVLTTVALSRRLGRESFGPHERVPTIARWVHGALPQVYRLHVPGEMIRELYPDEGESATLVEPRVVAPVTHARGEESTT